MCLSVDRVWPVCSPRAHGLIGGLFELTDLLGLFLLQVLESFKIMDYSLLLGIHILDHSLKDKEEEPLQNVPDAKRPGMQKVLYSTAMESIQGPGKSADGIIAENPDT